MRKETFADKMARKSFESAKIQQSWQVHFQTFRPILEPAFVDDFQAKIHLTAALNHISNRNFDKGLPKLQEMQKYIQTDADKAAYLFFMGLYCEMAGNLPQMAEMYDFANEYEHCFYWPYVKAAKFHQQCGEYDVAVDGYAEAIDCFETEQLSEQEKMIVASAFTNMATCLTMMHEYDDAVHCLENARSLGTKIPDSESVEAILYAAMGEKQKAENSLEQLKGSPVYEQIKTTIESIFDKTNPMFFPVEIDAVKIDQFWSWFVAYDSLLAERLNKEQYEEAMTPIAEKLLETFPFLEEPPLVSLGQNEEGYVIELRDMYFVAVRDAFEKLMSACPKEVFGNWQFVIVH